MLARASNAPTGAFFFGARAGRPTTRPRNQGERQWRKFNHLNREAYASPSERAPANNATWRRHFGAVFIGLGYEEAIVPAIWGADSFLRKAATEEIERQMWMFKDKGNRDCCLIPEATALFQEMAQTGEIRTERRIFYIARCYRYERPQEGRYREFTQLGVEILKPKAGIEQACLQAQSDARIALAAIGIAPESLAWNAQAARGLGYYVGGQGFEARANWLGASAQLLGGGAYAEGAGFAIGLERALLARSSAPSRPQGLPDAENVS